MTGPVLAEPADAVAVASLLLHFQLSLQLIVRSCPSAALPSSRCFILAALAAHLQLYYHHAAHLHSCSSPPLLLHLQLLQLITVAAPLRCCFPHPQLPQDFKLLLICSCLNPLCLNPLQPSPALLPQSTAAVTCAAASIHCSRHLRYYMNSSFLLHLHCLLHPQFHCNYSLSRLPSCSSTVTSLLLQRHCGSSTCSSLSSPCCCSPAAAPL